MPLPNIQDFKQFPDMTRWFNPILLFKLLANVLMSKAFGQYADRRLMIAALDDTPDTQFVARANIRLLPGFEPRPDKKLWFDFVADLGDGFDPTYAIAKLIAQEQMTIDGIDLPRAQLLVMGGDQVYPTASQTTYQNQLRQPYQLALNDPDKKSELGIPLFAVPGNHDWYDGLVMFLALFCRGEPWRFGAWRTHQTRSYFALQLTDTWWLWCTDIQLDDNMDAPQAVYFEKVAKSMPPGSRIILCSAEPGWLYIHKTTKPYDICEFAAGLACKFGKQLSVPIVLSGDTHHYSRYTSDTGDQFITAGGGGAFLHPTHQIPLRISLPGWLRTTPSLVLNACYPSKTQSIALLWRNLLFAVTNADFSLLLGITYWIFGLLLERHYDWDSIIAIFAIYIAAFGYYTSYQERTARARVWLVNLVHGALHGASAIALWKLSHALNTNVDFGHAWYSIYAWLGLTAVETIPLGLLAGGTTFGAYLAITCAWFDMNSNDAFSAMRLTRYKNFLRICIDEVTGEVTIFPVGLDRCPTRRQWVPAGTTFEPPGPLQPRLIEAPIIFR